MPAPALLAAGPGPAEARPAHLRGEEGARLRAPLPADPHAAARLRASAFDWRDGRYACIYRYVGMFDFCEIIISASFLELFFSQKYDYLAFALGKISTKHVNFEKV